MWVWCDRFGTVLLDAGLSTSVLLGVVVLVLLLCPQPARRISIVRPTMLFAVFMPGVVRFSPFPRFNPFSWLFGRLGPLLGGPPGWLQNTWTLRVVSIAYLVSATMGCLWLLLGYWSLCRLIRHSTTPRPLTQTVYKELVEENAFQSIAPELRVSERLQRPVFASLRRSFIVIPAALDDEAFDKASLRWVLVHELAHAQRNDSRLAALLSMAQTLWVFIPFIHWIRAQIRIDQEFLADQRAVVIAKSSAAYAKGLVSLANPGSPPQLERPRRTFSSTVRTTGEPGGSPLLLRVLMLLRAPYPLEMRAPRSWVLFSTLFILFLGCVCSCLTFGPTSPGYQLPGDALDPVPSDQSFRIDHFLAEPHSVRSGRSLPYVLPLILPPQFDLSAQIKVEESAISRVRLAGISLSPSGTSRAESTGPQDPETNQVAWHRVQLRRRVGTVEVSVDDERWVVETTAEPQLEWLSVEPPADCPVTLRNLFLTW